MTAGNGLLLYAPVPLFRRDNELFMEGQACNGLRLWAENFSDVTVMFPEEQGAVPDSWEPLYPKLGEDSARIKIVPLPSSYRPDQFALRFWSVRKIIRAEIAKAKYLSFGIGGLVGDWGALACYEAHKMGKRYAVWTDRVESDVVRLTAKSGTFRRRLRAKLEHRPMAWTERFLIRKSSLGLFHGKETFNAYADYCSEPQLVHDIHLKKEEHISDQSLNSKVAASTQGPLRILYTGRVDEMKGPHDWVEALNLANQAGVNFSATWLGDGPQLESVRKLVFEHGLSDKVEFRGFVTDRTVVLEALTKAQIFMFCHKTPESPRCLIESLACGAPIVGYHGAFAQDLIQANNGGVLVPLNDVAALAKVVIDLNGDRRRLGDLIRHAARDGEPYDDQSVFRHRSDIIKKYLGV